MMNDIFYIANGNSEIVLTNDNLSKSGVDHYEEEEIVTRDTDPVIKVNTASKIIPGIILLYILLTLAIVLIAIKVLMMKRKKRKK